MGQQTTMSCSCTMLIRVFDHAPGPITIARFCISMAATIILLYMQLYVRPRYNGVAFDLCISCTMSYVCTYHYCPNYPGYSDPVEPCNVTDLIPMLGRDKWGMHKLILCMNRVLYRSFR